MASFKGRVVKREGTVICIDTKPEPREYMDSKTGEKRFVSSAWLKPEYPRIGSVVRCNFHNKDKVG